MTSDDACDRALHAEALRVYRRYAVEVVEALDFCPWAAKARRDGAVREVVVLERGEPTDAALEAAAEVARDEAIEIGLLIFPRVRLGRLEFDRFVSRVRELDSSRWAPAPVPLAMAAFHPEAAPDLASPNRLTPFIRRTPDPTIQLVRQATLDRVRRNEQAGTSFFDASSMSLDELLAPAAEPLHERVARANHATVHRVGVAEVERILLEIKADRDRAYGRLGELEPLG
jgi:hypothetical protein